MREQAAQYGALREPRRATDLAHDGSIFTVTCGEKRFQARTVLLATGVVNHRPDGLDDALHDAALQRGLLRYCPICDGYEVTDKRVAVIGAGGIGFDICEYLVTGESPTLDLEAWKAEWGVGDPETSRGGLAGNGPQPESPTRAVTLLQRKATKLGKGLGKTTGWIHRASLKMKRVQMVRGVEYTKVDDRGLHFTIQGGEPQVIECDNVVVCAGQLSRRDLLEDLEAANIKTHLIGGSKMAGELDAKRAIREGFVLAAEI